jgi:hypothetical protein
MLSMSLELEGQGGHRVVQDTSPPEHKLEEQCEEPEHAWPCRRTMVLPCHCATVSSYEDLVIGCRCCTHVDEDLFSVVALAWTCGCHCPN